MYSQCSVTLQVQYNSPSTVYTTRLTFSFASDEPGSEETETSETDGE